MSKTYQYSGLTKELYQRLVGEHAALKQAHAKDYKQLFQEVRQCSEAQARIIYQAFNSAVVAINVTTVLRVVNRPVEAIVVHKADNATVLHGKVTGKEMVGKLYTLDCGPYGKFLVTKEQYDSVQVGDDIPSYLKGRGQ